MSIDVFVFFLEKLGESSDEVCTARDLARE